MTTHDSLLTQVEAGVAWITLNRTAQRNALDIPTLKKIHELLDAYNADPAVRVVVLTGTGRSFCAGADLDEWAAAEARAGSKAATAEAATTAAAECCDTASTATREAAAGTGVGDG